MPIAAVPAYLGNNFREASPGLRFGLFLPIWTTRQDQENEVNRRAQARSPEGQKINEQLQHEGMDTVITELCRRQRNPLPGLWDKNDFAAHRAWNDIKALSQSDKKRMEAIVTRQTALATTLSVNSLLSLPATAVAPFTTGLGNEHPLENGFSFLNPYGLPYLPGSGVKGVLRQAGRELAGGEWGDAHGWSEENRYDLPGSETVKHSMLDVLFGRETPGGDTAHLRGALIFWDVIPQIKGDSLMVEIMTPHQGHYYQGKATMGSISPHESGQPTPISFLTVPPGSGFVFHVQCNLTHLRRVAPDLAKDDSATGTPRWKTLLEAAFAHAFDWLGFGAKTAVGYGQFKGLNDAATVPRNVVSSVQAEQVPSIDPEAAQRAEMELFKKALPSLANLPSQIDGVIFTIRNKSDQETRKQCCQALFDFANTNKKKFKSAVKNDKQWAKKLQNLCTELGIGE